MHLSMTQRSRLRLQVGAPFLRQRSLPSAWPIFWLCPERSHNHNSALEDQSTGNGAYGDTDDDMRAFEATLSFVEEYASDALSSNELPSLSVSSDVSTRSRCGWRTRSSGAAAHWRLAVVRVLPASSVATVDSAAAGHLSAMNLTAMTPHHAAPAATQAAKPKKSTRKTEPTRTGRATSCASSWPSSGRRSRSCNKSCKRCSRSRSRRTICCAKESTRRRWRRSEEPRVGRVRRLKCCVPGRAWPIDSDADVKTRREKTRGSG